MSTPAAKTSELRASACDVSTPPYESPQMPTRAAIDVGARLQILARRDHIAILGVAAAAGVRRGAERLAVADPRAVVDRHHDVALAREPLVHRVRHVVEVHVVVAEQHLANRAAVHEDDRRPLFARLEILRQEELIVELDSVVRLERHRSSARPARPPGIRFGERRKDRRSSARRRSRVGTIARPTSAASRRTSAPRPAFPTRAAPDTSRSRRRS